jgi:hypothetical protein
MRVCGTIDRLAKSDGCVNMLLKALTPMASMDSGCYCLCLCYLVTSLGGLLGLGVVCAPPSAGGQVASDAASSPIAAAAAAAVDTRLLRMSPAQHH